MARGTFIIMLFSLCVAGVGFGATVVSDADKKLCELPIYNRDISFSAVCTYWDKHERLQEFALCFEKNLQCPFLKKMYVLYEKFSGTRPSFLNDPKIEIIPIDQIATHKDFYTVANRLPAGEIVVLMNADIFLTDTISLIKYIDFSSYAVALTRHNYYGGRIDGDGSQDVWILKTPIRYVDGNFRFNRFGTEHILVDELVRSGYVVINPCLSIITWHVHANSWRAPDVLAGFSNCPFYTIKIATLYDCLTSQGRAQMCKFWWYVRMLPEFERAWRVRGTNKQMWF